MFRVLQQQQTFRSLFATRSSSHFANTHKHDTVPSIPRSMPAQSHDYKIREKEDERVEQTAAASLRKDGEIQTRCALKIVDVDMVDSSIHVCPKLIRVFAFTPWPQWLDEIPRCTRYQSQFPYFMKIINAHSSRAERPFQAPAAHPLPLASPIHASLLIHRCVFSCLPLAFVPCH